MTEILEPFNIKSFVRRVDLLTLRLFLTLVEERQLARCAIRENIAASAVTKRIQDFEQAFGLKLFYRAAKGFSLTPAGHVVERHVRLFFGTLASMRSELSDFVEGARGHVRLWANESCIVEFLAGDIGQFAMEYPQVAIELHEARTPDVLNAVERGDADLGIFAPIGEPKTNLQIIPYRTDRLCAVIPRRHALAVREEVSLSDVLEAGFIGFDANTSLMQQIEMASSQIGRELQLRYRVASNLAARSLVEAGLGVTIQPDGMLVNELSPTVVIVPLSDGWAKRSLQIAMRHEDLPLAARLFLKNLTDPPKAGS